MTAQTSQTTATASTSTDEVPLSFYKHTQLAKLLPMKFKVGSGFRFEVVGKKGPLLRVFYQTDYMHCTLQSIATDDHDLFKRLHNKPTDGYITVLSTDPRKPGEPYWSISAKSVNNQDQPTPSWRPPQPAAPRQRGQVTAQKEETAPWLAGQEKLRQGTSYNVINARKVNKNHYATVVTDEGHKVEVLLDFLMGIKGQWPSEKVDIGGLGWKVQCCKVLKLGRVHGPVRRWQTKLIFK